MLLFCRLISQSITSYMVHSSCSNPSKKWYYYGYIYWYSIRFEGKGKQERYIQKKKHKIWKSQRISFFSVSLSSQKKAQIGYNKFLSIINRSVPRIYFFALGQDMNANIGCKGIKDEFSCIWPHGFKNSKSKVTETINLLNMHNWFASLKFFNIKTILLGGSLMVKTHRIIRINRFLIH